MAQTDNSYLADKVMLRVNHLPERDPITVLDCYAGKGLIWKNIVRLTGRKIRRLPVDFRDGIGFHLPGNNLAYLTGGMNLDTFDVIDLDAYGIPYLQTKALFRRNYRGVVFATFCQSIMGRPPDQMLLDAGFSQEMIAQIPTIYGKIGWPLFKQFLASYGIRCIHHRHAERKHYLAFSCAERCI
jgi:hypothetical protein